VDDFLRKSSIQNSKSKVLFLPYFCISASGQSHSLVPMCFDYVHSMEPGGETGPSSAVFGFLPSSFMSICGPSSGGGKGTKCNRIKREVGMKLITHSKQFAFFTFLIRKFDSASNFYIVKRIFVTVGFFVLSMLMKKVSKLKLS
jgi:hypothetical protein